MAHSTLCSNLYRTDTKKADGWIIIYHYGLKVILAHVYEGVD